MSEKLEAAIAEIVKLRVEGTADRERLYRLILKLTNTEDEVVSQREEIEKLRAQIEDTKAWEKVAIDAYESEGYGIEGAMYAFKSERAQIKSDSSPPE